MSSDDGGTASASGACDAGDEGIGEKSESDHVQRLLKCENPPSG